MRVALIEPLSPGRLDAAALAESAAQLPRPAAPPTIPRRGGFAPRILQLRRPLVQQFLSRRFLLRIHLPARLFQCLPVLPYLFRGGCLRGFRVLLRANGARVPLRHHLQQRLKEKRP